MAILTRRHLAKWAAQPYALGLFIMLPLLNLSFLVSYAGAPAVVEVEIIEADDLPSTQEYAAALRMALAASTEQFELARGPTDVQVTIASEGDSASVRYDGPLNLRARFLALDRAALSLLQRNGTAAASFPPPPPDPTTRLLSTTLLFGVLWTALPRSSALGAADRTTGWVRTLRRTRARLGEIVVADVLHFVLLMLIQAIGVLVVARFYFGIRPLGGALDFLGLFFGMGAALVGWGLLLGALAPNQRVASTLAIACAFVLMFVSGAAAPLSGATSGFREALLWNPIAALNLAMGNVAAGESWRAGLGIGQTILALVGPGLLLAAGITAHARALGRETAS